MEPLCRSTRSLNILANSEWRNIVRLAENDNFFLIYYLQLVPCSYNNKINVCFVDRSSPIYHAISRQPTSYSKHKNAFNKFCPWIKMTRNSWNLQCGAVAQLQLAFAPENTLYPISIRSLLWKSIDIITSMVTLWPTSRPPMISNGENVLRNHEIWAG